ncbi:MAG: hypothetical protein O3C49_05725 [Proteobacteria bacterium]|nr:hypothetical protein [Pseudomonadota bacterium]
MFPRIPEEIILGAWPGPVIYQTIEPLLCGGYVAAPDGIPSYTFLVRSGGPGSNLLNTCAVTEAGEAAR